MTDIEEKSKNTQIYLLLDIKRCLEFNNSEIKDEAVKLRRECNVDTNTKNKDEAYIEKLEEKYHKLMEFMWNLHNGKINEYVDQHMDTYNIKKEILQKLL